MPKLKRAKKTQKNNLDHEIEVAALNEGRGRDKGQQRQHFDGLPQRLQIIVFLQQLNHTMRLALGISNRFSVASLGLGGRSPADLHWGGPPRECACWRLHKAAPCPVRVSPEGLRSL